MGRGQAAFWLHAAFAAATPGEALAWIRFRRKKNLN